MMMMIMSATRARLVKVSDRHSVSYNDDDDDDDDDECHKGKACKGE